MEILISTSLVAAFLAGIAALFAPCCITVLLPTYLASIFRERRTVFLMTFVFFLGLLAVFLPLGLGAAGVGQIFSRFHDTIFTVGSLLLLFFGASLLIGKSFSLPFSTHISMPIQNTASVFGLGIFSGFATLCCAPVLAGVLALSMLPGSFALGALYATVYVLGMTLPLFFLAIFIDKTKIMSRLKILKKTLSYSFLGNEIRLTAANMIAGITFLGMGMLIFYLAQTGQLISHSSAQIGINIYMSRFTAATQSFAGKIPAAILIALFVGALIAIVALAYRKISAAKESAKKCCDNEEAKK